MKITLEFDSQLELDEYIEQQKLRDNIEQRESTDIDLPSDFVGDPVRDVGRRKRKPFTQLELQVIRKYYMYKKVPWIANQLRRKPEAVYNKLMQMYKEGLPKKRSRNGKEVIN